MIMQALQICALSLADLMLTYLSMSYLIKNKPISISNETIYNYEMNVFLRYFWKRYGLDEGMFYGSIFIVSLMLFVSFFASIDHSLYSMILGAYAVIIALHYHNLTQIIMIEKRKNAKLKDR